MADMIKFISVNNLSPIFVYIMVHSVYTANLLMSPAPTQKCMNLKIKHIPSEQQTNSKDQEERKIEAISMREAGVFKLYLFIYKTPNHQ